MPTQKWEYAYIYWYREGEDSHWLSLALFHPSGVKSRTLAKEKMWSKTPDFRKQFNEWIIELGENGYEMTGVTSTSNSAGYPSYEYWFKRPLD